MLYQLARVLLLGTAMMGLCSSTQANTTATETVFLPIGMVPVAVTSTGMRLEQSVTTAIANPPDTERPVRIALLLPLQSDTLNQAANAVRAGFLAAHEREKEGIAVNVVDTQDAAQDVLSHYLEAVEQNDIVVGPLSRSGVTAIVQDAVVRKPTIALTQPEPFADVDAELPSQLLVVGLSIEDEARQAAVWAGADKKIGKAFVLSTSAAWQRRAARAFAVQWQKQGGDLEPIELKSSGGALSPKALVQLKKQIQMDRQVLLFAALDVKQARQVRAVLGNDIPLYGTSQLNPFALSDRHLNERIAEMEGARLLDIPWQLQSDHPAVMVYSRPVVSADQKRSADLERLYALGIDAYRVAKEIASKNTSFELDGVTGKLTVRFGPTAPFFERMGQKAVYKEGGVMAVVNSR